MPRFTVIEIDIAAGLMALAALAQLVMFSDWLWHWR